MVQFESGKSPSASKGFEPLKPLLKGSNIRWFLTVNVVASHHCLKGWYERGELILHAVLSNEDKASNFCVPTWRELL